jgi:hypothetical protein
MDNRVVVKRWVKGGKVMCIGVAEVTSHGVSGWGLGTGTMVVVDKRKVVGYKGLRWIKGGEWGGGVG